MSRTYQIFLVAPALIGTSLPDGAPLRVDADDCDLEFSQNEDSVELQPAAFNFTKGEDNISVAWVPFEMVKAIIS